MNAAAATPSLCVHRCHGPSEKKSEMTIRDMDMDMDVCVCARLSLLASMAGWLHGSILLILSFRFLAVLLRERPNAPGSCASGWWQQPSILQALQWLGGG